MTQLPTNVPGARFSTTPGPGARGTSGWTGWIGFAAVMLGLLGVLQAFEGIVALVSGTQSRGSELLLHLDMSSWGWLHILTGAFLLLTAVGVLGGWLWARIVGTLLAVVSALLNLAFLTAQPIWALIMIALAVIVIMALTVHGSEIRPDRS